MCQTHKHSEPIWINSGTVWAKCCGLYLANFGRDPLSSDSLRESRSFGFCPLNNARFHRFPVEKKLRHFNTTTSLSEAVKTFGTKVWKFYRKESFFQKKTQTLLTKFPRLATSGRHNSAMINAGNSLNQSVPLLDVSFPFLPLESIQSLSLGMYAPYGKRTYPKCPGSLDQIFQIAVISEYVSKFGWDPFSDVRD